MNVRLVSYSKPSDEFAVLGIKADILEKEKIMKILKEK